MYLAFYKLKHKPFQISTDPRFLWLGEKHEEALATLRYGVLDNKGFLLLTGDVGTGKTTLINALLKTLGKNTLVASIRDPALDPIDFYNYTAHAFGMEANFTSKASFLIQFERYLHDAHTTNKRVLLIIDEAQRINQVLLEEVRLLSNIEREDSKLLNIFFVGQLEFNEILLRPENRAIRQRITINYNISALSEQETGQYIKHRLQIAEAEKKDLPVVPTQTNEKAGHVQSKQKPPDGMGEIFTFGAIKEIHSFSKGYPRLINIICDRSLLTGFVEESPIITRKHVTECIRELTIPQFQQTKSTIENVSTGDEKNTAAQQQEQISKNSRSVTLKHPEKKAPARNMLLATGFVLFLVLCYFIVSDSENPVLRGQAIVELVRGFRPQTDYVAETKGKGTTAPEDIKGFSGNNTGNNSAQETTGTAAVTAVQQKQSNEPESLKNNPTIKQNPEAKPEDKEFVKSGNTDPAPMPDNIVPEKMIPDETEQIAAQEIYVKSLVTFEKLVIPFASNSNFPPANSLDNLNMLVDSLLAQPSYTVVVTGFTDSQGNEAFNEKLAEFRANTVKSYMVGRGLKESQIISRGFGSQNPIASNDTYAGRMANRRVEIEINRKD